MSSVSIFSFYFYYYSYGYSCICFIFRIFYFIHGVMGVKKRRIYRAALNRAW